MRRRPSEAVLALLALLAIVGVLTACGGDDESDEATTTPATADEPVAGGTLRFGLASETSGWNPSVDQFNLSSYQITQAVYDRMVAYDQDGTARPYLVESIEPNEDFTEWTIGLRPDIEFHDGTPLDSAVLAQNLQATKDSPLLGQVFQAVERIEAVDASTVVVTLDTPWSSFPHTLTAQPGLIVAPSVLEGGLDPVGTGPFVFEEWVRDDRLTVTRNDDYWRSGYPLLDGIEFRVITDPASRTASFETGELDIMEVRDATAVGTFEARATEGEVVVYLDDDGETVETVVLLNTAVAPFDDPLAREAVAHGLDRETISEVVYAGRFPPAEGPFKQGSPWDQGVVFPPHDPAKAAEAAAAYEAARGEPIAFALTVVPGSVNLQQAQLIQQILGELGITVDLRSTEATQAIVDVLAGDFQMSTSTGLWGSTHPDREYTFLVGSNALPPGQLATNFTRMASDEIDAGMDAARRTDDPDEQSAAWGRVQEAMAEELGYLFLVHNDVGDVATSRLRDVNRWTLPDGTPGLPQEQNVISLYQVWLEDS